MIVVVPARGNSKGVPRKNLAVVDGKPLLCHIADTAIQAGHRVVVSTEDPEIRSVALAHGYLTHDRPPHLSADDIPVADVARDVLEGFGDQPFIIAQPTCPNVTAATLRKLGDLLTTHQAVTLMAPASHILRDGTGRLTAAVNRQQLTGTYREVGVRAFSSCASLDVPPTGLEIPEGEALDIDTHAELAAAGHGRRILFDTVGDYRTGSGHVHRTAALAAALSHHLITVTGTVSTEMKPLLQPWKIQSADPIPDLVVLDHLDTTIQEVTGWKAKGCRVVTVEDQGPGARHADLVVNALYPHGGLPHELSGPDYADLRPEFVGLPEYTVSDLGRVLVMFGGTDPAMLGLRVKKLLEDTPRVHQITWVRPGDRIPVAYEMLNHDLLVTSGGRTVYEAAAVGIPTIVVAQNHRETTHAHLGQGNINLGLGQILTDETIRHAVQSVLADTELRGELSRSGSVDGMGLKRIVHHIEGLLL